MHKWFVSYLGRDEDGGFGFGRKIVTTNESKMTAKSIAEIEKEIESEYGNSSVIIINFIEIGD